MDAAIFFLPAAVFYYHWRVPKPSLVAGMAESALDDASLLSSLNEEQRMAVESTQGPLLVLAGAGTGKTRVLTTRIAHILLNKMAWPGEILAVTFTNKAAREMQERVTKMTGASQALWMGTFHSIGARIIRRHAEKLGLTSSFTILDADDQISFAETDFKRAEY